MDPQRKLMRPQSGGGGWRADDELEDFEKGSAPPEALAS
jgi:hypothetical protein